MLEMKINGHPISIDESEEGLVSYHDATVTLGEQIYDALNHSGNDNPSRPTNGQGAPKPETGDGGN